MALQAGLPLLDFSGFDKERQEEYFAAIRQGLDRNYKPMTNIFADILLVRCRFMRSKMESLVQ
jgi:cell filamentation protein